MSCLALVVTALSFSLRAGILVQLGDEFGLSGTQLGWINGVAFLGFPIAIFVGGLVYNEVGPKRLMIIALVGHVAGILLTAGANGFWLLLVSTFFIGLGNGAVEAACNPMIADMYHRNKTTRLNLFHVWFPGGIVIGSLLTFFLGDLIGWRLLILLMLLPTAVYAYLIFTEVFPKTMNTVSSTVENIKALANPLFIALVILMTLTAATELGTTQWIERVLYGSGAHPMLVLGLIFGIMALARQFAGPIVHRFNPIGVLLGSAIVSTAGIFLLANTSGNLIYISAAVFAFGVTYFWPTMLGTVGEYLPRTGAIGLSIIGGMGMFGLTVWNPVIGGWIDSAREAALTSGVTAEMAEVAAGQAVLQRLNILPVILIVAFGVLLALRLKRPDPSERDPNVVPEQTVVR